MEKIKAGDKLKCIFDAVLPGNTCGPKVKAGTNYECVSVHTDKSGRDHINIGLALTVGSVSAYETGEDLPGTTHWCHPNRFIIVNK